MRIYDIIQKKKMGCVLTEEEITFAINGYVNEETPDYQISALLMAICFQNLNSDEIFYLTKAMVESGDVIDLSTIDGITIDKHSTGGVGDKTSLTLLPMLAAAGLKGSKMSGRGLGHTGGTLDKLESIDGFNINLTPEESAEIIKNNNFVICGQTLNLVPADKKLYSLRDVTATVDNIGLIASSIMSKKIASGAKNIILDVKMGSGAFMKDLKSAIELSEKMVDIGSRFGRNVRAIITNMDEPLGYAVGNSLEVIEAIETLKGNGPKDFEELCMFLCANLLEMTNLTSSVKEGIQISKEILDTKKALNRFEEFVRLQRGNVNIVSDYSKFKTAEFKIDITSLKEGIVDNINAEMIGTASLIAGGGRLKKTDEIDYSVGLMMKKKVGEKVAKGDIIATLYLNDKTKLVEIEKNIRDAFSITNEFNKEIKLIHGIVTDTGFVPYEKI